jgi:hypothetical protein
LHTIVTGAQFTEEFGFVPITEFHETETGCIYTGARRNGEFVWVRVVDFILPNIHQFPPPWETASQERIFNRPLMTNWNVPIDDVNTMRIGFVHRKLDEERDAAAIRKGAGFGHWERPDYEERQRVPWDFDAQVSQRPVAVHALEHLGSTDRGVTLLRKVLRRAIRANSEGADPRPYPKTDGVILTQSQDTVVRMPPGATEDEEHATLLEIGRRVAGGYYTAQKLGQKVE